MSEESSDYILTAILRTKPYIQLITKAYGSLQSFSHPEKKLKTISMYFVKQFEITKHENTNIKNVKGRLFHMLIIIILSEGVDLERKTLLFKDYFSIHHGLPEMTVCDRN